MTTPPILSGPSTTVQWTMRLEDAALIHETLLAAANQATSSADYLAGDRYAEEQRRLAKAKDKDAPAWELSTQDRDRITEMRSKATRLHRLAGA